ncbi:MAG: hypothetical protein HYR63_15715 [Proteobacteria bacterium]|nr:hypothetical protein [Pseudomonadota bacterium]MBI3499741.1 hypothetical protein [Pseudomonadota bacterium]
MNPILSVVAGAIAATLISVAVQQAIAQTGAAGRDCFHVAYANQGAVPATAIKWNSCTGDSWLMLKVALPEKQGKPNGFLWEWLVVPTDTNYATSPN